MPMILPVKSVKRTQFVTGIISAAEQGRADGHWKIMKGEKEFEKPRERERERERERGGGDAATMSALARSTKWWREERRKKEAMERNYRASRARLSRLA
jgi:hypothetical protein